jgi:muramoyltetrapeptide carboxypeptidase LdcA involved in peptidoglycan recycling
MKKVARLSRNSVIAIVSPSWGGPASFPWVYQLGLNCLRKEFGFKIREYPTTTGDPAHNHQHPEERARDLVAAFQDDSIDGIICSIGGDDSVMLLKYLDQYKFPPKFFMGYSDSTILLNYLNQRGFVTFHGPSIMAGFAQPDESNNEFIEHVENFLNKKWESYTYKPFTKWTEKLLNWNDPQSKKDTVRYQKNEGWKLLVKSKSVEEMHGSLWGGCLDALEFIKGTKYWHASDLSWENKILFLELSDEGMTSEQFKSILRNYGTQGAFNHIGALLVGRFANVTLEKKKLLEKIIVEVVCDEFSSQIPIITDMDFGHTYPQQILPLGADSTLKIVNGSISLTVENPFI